MKAIKTVILALLIVIGIAGGAVFLRQYMGSQSEFSEQRAAAEELAAEAQARYDAAQASVEDGTKQLEETAAESMEAARERIDSLTEENKALAVSIETAERELAEKQADETNTYYQEVYDVTLEGMEKVEKLIEGN